MPSKKIKTHRPLRRVSAADSSVAREVLKTLATLGEPPELTQRRLFIELIPHIYVMRKRFGYTFKQINKLCHENGLKLSQSTIRVYYAHFVPQMKTECEAALVEIEQFTQKITILAAQRTLDSLESRAQMTGGYIPLDQI